MRSDSKSSRLQRWTWLLGILAAGALCTACEGLAEDDLTAEDLASYDEEELDGEEREMAAVSGGGHFEVAWQDDGQFFTPGPVRERAFALARQAGVTRIRTQMFWDSVGNDQGAMDFSRFDGLVDAARAAGFKVQMTIVGCATWNPNGSKWVSYEDPNIDHYRIYAAAVAAHFKGRVDRYSIWNEPNLAAFLRPQKKAHLIYRRLYKAGYKAIKTVDPQAKVLFAETSPRGNGLGTATDPMKFIRRVVRGQKLKADGYAHHPYRFEQSPTAPQGDKTTITISDLPELRRVLARLRKRGELKTPAGKTPPLYLTEFGYFVTGKRAISEAKRVKWTVQAYRSAYRKRAYVRQLLYYHAIQNPNHPWNTGLLTPDGNATPQYEALKAWTCRRKPCPAQ